MGKQLFCLLSGLLFALSGVFAGEYSIRGVTDKPVAIYQPGEAMIFTLKVLEDDKPVSGFTIKWTRTGDDGEKDSGEGTVDGNGFKITTSMNKPGFVRIQVSAFDVNGKKLQGYINRDKIRGDIFFDGGACVAPEKLAPVAEPEDFDAFWKEMKTTLDTVPVKAERRELESINPKVKIYAVTVDCAGPKAVTGYLTIPANAAAKSLPGVVSFHGYGVDKHIAPTSGDEKSISFNVNAHGMKLGEDDVYYTQLKTDLKKYAFNVDENADPKKSYFYGMSLRVMRALQYVKSLPEWNGKSLASNGGSQGGLQGLWGAALDKNVTSCDAWSPWCCDMGGITLGRQRGWRPEYTEALNYYDPVFHAKRIKGKVKLIANYGDYSCPASGVWVVYNQIPGTNKLLEVRQGCTHPFSMKNYPSYVFSPEGISDIKNSN